MGTASRNCEICVIIIQLIASLFTLRKPTQHQPFDNENLLFRLSSKTPNAGDIFWIQHTYKRSRHPLEAILLGPPVHSPENSAEGRKSRTATSSLMYIAGPMDRGVSLTVPRIVGNVRYLCFALRHSPELGHSNLTVLDYSL